MRVREVTEDHLADFTVFEVTDDEDATLDIAVVTDRRLADAAVKVVTDSRNAVEFVKVVEGVLVGSSPGFSPLDISGLALWLRADSINLSDGDAVNFWADQSGLGRHMEQATAAQRPTFRANVINNLPVVQFDGSDDRLLRSSPFLVGSSGSLFAVVRFDTFTSFPAWLFSSDTGSATRRCGVFADSAQKLAVIQQNADTSDWMTGNENLGIGIWRILEAHSNGSSYELVVDGRIQTLTITSGANNGDWFADATSLDNVVVGANVHSVVTSLLDGEVAEQVAYDGVVLTPVQKLRVRNYLADKYNIPV